jgi:hypothetical protein
MKCKLKLTVASCSRWRSFGGSVDGREEERLASATGKGKCLAAGLRR